MPLERLVTDGERIVQEVAYRFQGRDGLFRLSVEQGLQKNDTNRSFTLSEIVTHTKAYLADHRVDDSLNGLVKSLLHAIDVSNWTATREHFNKKMNTYISDAKARVNSILIDKVKLAAQNAIQTLNDIHVRVCPTIHIPLLNSILNV